MKECPSCRRCFTDDINNCPDDGEATAFSIMGEPVLDGRYQLEKRLGQGGMGAVYKARHIFLKTAHAIKIILPDLVGNDPELVKRFRQEALAAAAIRHANVIAVTDYGVVNGKMPFLVMEFVSGLSLHEVLVQEGALPAGRVVEYMRAICAGVAAAHRQKIVHRDLKPLNIMLQQGLPVAEGLKVLDFGLAKIKSGELLGSFVQAQTTGLMGSPFYMAPEQWSDEEPDARADIYSLGILMYQMLTGDVPFKGNGIPSIMKKHLTMEPPPMVSWGVHVPTPIEAVVRHALQKERTKRPLTVEAFLEEINQAAAAATSELMNTLGDEAGPTTGAARPAQATNEIDFATSPLTLSQPTTTLKIRTYPALASVFVNNVPVGTSNGSGDLTLRNMLQGNHRLMVVRDGYAEWVSDIFCEEGEYDLEIALDALEEGQKPGPITEPGYITLSKTANDRPPQHTYGGQSVRMTAAGVGPTPPAAMQVTMMAGQQYHGSFNPQAPPYQTGGLPYNNSSPALLGTPVITPTPAPKPFPTALLAALAGVVVVILGVGGYALFLRPAASGPDKPGPTVPTTAGKSFQPEYAVMPGGSFKMGRKNGVAQEIPEHNVTVQPFEMSKTEVTNSEYAEFIAATKHPAPSYFDNNGKPPAGQELWPVCNVNVADAEAFAKWRSQKEGKNYRLPTEEEWEYAARNGDQNTLYPWGNTWQDSYAATKEAKIISLQPVGTYPNGQNRWGVMDLIGNVWEWTSSKASVYAGNPAEVAPQYANYRVLRGGSFQAEHTGKQPISSTYRDWLDPTLKDLRIGFRLVRAGS